jgi:Zn-dependent protease with chaperone function
MTATRMARGREEATRALALGAWTAISLAAASLLWRTRVPVDLRLPPVDERAYFTPRQLRDAHEYARVARLIWVGWTVSQVAVLAALAALGPRIAARLRGGMLRRGLVMLAVVLAAIWLARLPFGVVSLWWRRRHGLSHQGYLAWLVSPWLELLASALVAAVALVGAMLLARRLGRRWWIAGGPLLAVLGAATVLLQPLVLTPRLEPLRDPALAVDIARLEHEVGVDPMPVDVKRAADRTTTANAEAIGIGPTRRIVLWDTLLDGRFSRSEIHVIVAHELGHVARRHIWKGVAWFVLLATPLVLVLALATAPLGGLSNPGAVPLAALVVLLLELAVLPFANAISRRYEAEADWIALETTHDPAALRGVVREFAVTSLGDPDPPAWSRTFLGTHPTILERIAMAKAWAERRR